MIARRPPETAPSAPHEIVFDHYDREDEARRESLFSLGNGVLVARASAPEGGAAECCYAGTYHAGLYERLEAVEDGQQGAIESLVRLPDWLSLRFRVEGEADWFSLRDVEILSYRHRLDLSQGMVFRDCLVRDGKGRATRLLDERLVSMAEPHLLALRLRLVPQDWSGRLEIRSGLDAGVRNDMVAKGDGYDPQAFDVARLEVFAPGTILAEIRTRRTGRPVAVSVRTRLVADGAPQASDGDAVARGGTAIEERYACAVGSGRAVVVEKTAAILAASDPGRDAPGEASRAALAAAPGFDELKAAHVRAWSALWERLDLRIGDEALARPAMLHVFHLLQTVSPHSAGLDVGLPSRGWQEAYHGQIFWDETLSFPFLCLAWPQVARALLVHRHRRLDAARRAAREAGFGGAMFPWRSAETGEEVTPAFQHNPLSGRWMRDETFRQRHVGSAIAYNVWTYALATGDTDFLADHGAELLVEIARFWASIARPDPASGRCSIVGVVGPDEFHTTYPGADAPGLRDNAYTNFMAAWTLGRAEEALDLLPKARREALVRRLGVDPEEIRRWDRVARGLRIAFDEDGLVSQFDGFEALEPFDLPEFERRHPGGRVDWTLEAEGEDVNAYRVAKQADFAMLLHLLGREEVIRLAGRMGHPLDADRLKRTVERARARTAHDSSLSNLVYAGALSDLDPAVSWALYRQSLHPDEKTGHSGTEKGIHLGAMAATLDILVRLYLGIRPERDGLAVDPAPPPDLGAVALRIRFRGGAFVVALGDGRLTVRADAGNPAAEVILHGGTRHRMEPGAVLDIPLGAGERRAAAE